MIRSSSVYVDFNESVFQYRCMGGQGSRRRPILSGFCFGRCLKLAVFEMPKESGQFDCSKREPWQCPHFSQRHNRALSLVLAMLMSSTFIGCGNLKYWRNNDHKVGPNYATPSAPIAVTYSDEGSSFIDTNFEPYPCWWEAFDDDDLNLIVELLRRQNLSLKAAWFRIKESRHLRQIAAANLLPQSQQGFGSFAHTQNSTNGPNFMPGFVPLTINDWQLGLDVSWELDLWGRLRRTVTAADANVCFNVHDRNAILISLIGDAASLYIQIRSLDERIELAQTQR